MRTEKREDNESENNENGIDVEEDATSDDDDEIMKDDYYLKSLCQS